MCSFMQIVEVSSTLSHASHFIVLSLQLPYPSCHHLIQDWISISCPSSFSSCIRIQVPILDSSLSSPSVCYQLNPIASTPKAEQGGWVCLLKAHENLTPLHCHITCDTALFRTSFSHWLYWDQILNTHLASFILCFLSFDDYL